MNRALALAGLVLLLFGKTHAQIDMITPVFTGTGEETTIHLDWTEVPELLSNIEGYELERSLDGDSYDPVDNFPPEVLTFSDTDLEEDTRYYYQLIVNVMGDDPTTYSLITGTLPSAPDGLVATTESAVQIRLTWNDNSSIEGAYVIERTEDPDGTFQEVSTTDNNSETYHDDTGFPETTYFYRVGAVGLGGTSYSNVASATTGNGSIVYVNGNAEVSGNGSSWDEALRTINEGITTANSGDQIWVAVLDDDGSYSPGPEQTDRYDVSKTGLRFYGGFIGNETTTEEREAFKTNVSGDIGEPGSPDDNIHRLFDITGGASSTTLFDGFVFKEAYGLGSRSDGAAIVSSSNLIINNCDFTDNNAENGGGIYTNTTIDITITGCQFNGNSTDGSGGAIYFSSDGTLNISSSTFQSNSADQNGGGIYQFGGTSILSDNLFDGNGSQYGGAMYLTASGRGGTVSSIITNVEFKTNNASGGGGAIDLEANGALTLIESQFTSNTGGAEVGGGAIVARGLLDAVQITSSQFDSNQASNDGGAVLFESLGTLTINQSEFHNNSAADRGGAIYFDMGMANIDQSVFAGNKADGSGGAFYGLAGETNTIVSIANSTFHENEAPIRDSGGTGGALDLRRLETTIENTTFTNNLADRNGGAIREYDGDLILKNCLFRENHANNAGGAITTGANTLDISGSTFTGNSCVRRGGAIAVNGGEGSNNTNMQVTNSTFSTNTSEASGGAISWGPGNSSASANLDHVTIFNNSAMDSGGGISAFNTVHDIFKFTNTIIAGNTGSDNRPDLSVVSPNQTDDVVLTEGVFFSGGHNLIGNLGGFIFDMNTTGDRYGDPMATTTPHPEAIESGAAIDPMIADLADNDSDVPTNALLLGSPAINNGSISVVDDTEIVSDQRGVAYLGTPDIGAFEFYLTSPPVLNTELDLVLTTINEDDLSNPGDLLENIAQTNLVTDSDGPDLGIAITAVDVLSGSWQYSLDNGSNWTEIGSPNSSAALLLPINDMTRVRFLPTSNFNGTINDAVTFKAWDQALGTAGGTLDVSNFVADSPFSDNAQTISITVNPVNDLPQVVNPIADIAIPLGRFSFTFSDDVFNDVEDGTALTFSLEGLPSFLNFDASTRTISANLVSGTPQGSNLITLVATDNEGGTGSDVFDILIDPLLSVQNEEPSSLTLYPVPSNGWLNITWQDSHIGTMQVRVLDQVGREVIHQQLMKNTPVTSNNLDLTGLKEGLYMLELITSKGRVLKRFIIN